MTDVEPNDDIEPDEVERPEDGGRYVPTRGTLAQEPDEPTHPTEEDMTSDDEDEETD